MLVLPADTLSDRRDAMGVDWMTRDELCESIPPAFTQFIGEQLLQALEVAGMTESGVVSGLAVKP